MFGERESERSGRRDWPGTVVACAVIAVLCGIPVAGASAVVPGIPAVVAVAALLGRRLSRRLPLRYAMVGACVVSLAFDVWCIGPAIMIAVWLCVELTVLLLLTVAVVRRVPAPAVFLLSGLVCGTAAVLPLRLMLRMPRVEVAGSALAVMMTLMVVAVALGVGLYLRHVDARRVRAVSHARRAQRLDLARDLHDFVAHEVTGIVLEAQGAQLGGNDEAQFLEAFARIEQAGLRALSSMDHTVQALRDPEDMPADETPTPRLYNLSDLPEVVERFSVTGGVRTELAIDADVGTIPREWNTAAYRVVVEALTNIRRHAPNASHITVSITRTDGVLETIVANDGGGRSQPGSRAGGTGLIGLAERIQALGGSLVAGPHDDGWQVACRLPLPAAAYAPAAPVTIVVGSSAVPPTPSGDDQPN